MEADGCHQTSQFKSRCNLMKMRLNHYKSHCILKDLDNMGRHPQDYIDHNGKVAYTFSI